MTAKKRKITTIEDVDDEQESPESRLSIEDEQSIDALDEFSHGFGPKEIRYRVHRVSIKGREFIWSDNAAPEDWELWLQQHFGGGEYDVSALAPNGLSRSFRVMVAALPQTMAGANPGGSNGSFLERELLRRMDAMEARLTQPIASTPVREIIEGMKVVHELGGGSNSSLGGFDKLAEVFKLGMELGRDASGKTDSWIGILGDVAKEVGKPLVQTLLAARQPLPNNNEVVTVQSQNIDDAMKAGIQWLKKQAMAGVDPTALLHLVEANAQEYEPFIRFAVDREFEAFAAIDAEISSPTYINFFKALHDGLRSDFGKTDPVDANPSGTGGDVADVNSNGKTGKRRK